MRLFCPAERVRSMWIELGAAAAIATAVFTGASAYLAWLQHQGSLICEWHLRSFVKEQDQPAILLIALTLRNNLQHGIRLERVDVKGIPLATRVVVDHGPGTANEWPKTASALIGEVAPGGTYSTLLRVIPDWSHLSTSSRKQRNRYITGTITVASSSDNLKKIRLSRKMLIPAKTIATSIAMTNVKSSE